MKMPLKYALNMDTGCVELRFSDGSEITIVVHVQKKRTRRCAVYL